MRPSAIVIEWIGACPVRDRCARACHRTRLVSTRLECVVVNRKQLSNNSDGFRESVANLETAINLNWY